MDSRQYMQHGPSCEESGCNDPPLQFYPMADPNSTPSTAYPAQQQQMVQSVAFDDPFCGNSVPESMVPVTSALGLLYQPSAAPRQYPSHLPHLPHLQTGHHSPSQAGAQFGPPAVSSHPGHNVGSSLEFSRTSYLPGSQYTPEITVNRTGTDFDEIGSGPSAMVRHPRTSITSSITSSPGLLSLSSFSQGDSSPSISSPLPSGGNLSPDVTSPSQARRGTLSSLSRGGSGRSTARRKRTCDDHPKREAEGRDGEDEHMDSEANSTAKRRRPGNSDPSGPSLACPLYQHSRTLGTGACYGPGFADWGRVKEHLIRAHSLKDRVYCQHCKAVFDKTSDELAKHKKAGNCVANNKFDDSFIDDDKLEKVQQIKNRKLNSQQKWELAYKILYPNERVHSAFNDSVSFDAIRAEVVELYEEELRAPHDFGTHQVEPETIGLLMNKLNRAFEKCAVRQGLHHSSGNPSEISLPASLQNQQTAIHVPTCNGGGTAINMAAHTGVLQDPHQPMFPTYTEPFPLPTSMDLGFFPPMNGHGPT